MKHTTVGYSIPLHEMGTINALICALVSDLTDEEYSRWVSEGQGNIMLFMAKLPVSSWQNEFVECDLGGVALWK